MRALFASTANSGHFGPIVPVAEALVRAGWDVVVATPESFADQVRRAGFEVAALADVPGEIVGPAMAQLEQLPPDQTDRVVLADIFGRLDAQSTLPGLIEAIERWRPDVVIREQAEFGSLAAAARAGVPLVQVAIGMARCGPLFYEAVREPLAELAEMVGVDPAELAAIVTGSPTISSVPSSLAAADLNVLGPDAHADPITLGPIWRFRDGGEPRPVDLPAVWGSAGLPLVYVTFGSVVARLPPFRSVFRDAVTALGDYPARILLTTGQGFEVAELGTLPSNVHVEPWWPQESVLGAATAMVGHGGFGTTMATLAAGLPQIVIPLFSADQQVHAAQVEAVGAGIRLRGGLTSLPELPAQLDRLLGGPDYRQRAEAIAADIAALPPADALPQAIADFVG